MQDLEGQDPREVGDFGLIGRLGQGGFGRVYLGRSATGSLVAVKVAHAHHSQDPEFRERFRREVTAIRTVSGWFTAALVDADPEAGRPWLATEFIPAPTLQDVVDRCGPLPPQAVWWLALGVAKALVTIHRAGLLHRDLKPGNVLIAADGVWVIDFGIAKIVEAARYTRSGVLAGTPNYMPPEQVDLHAVTGAGDVYALAASLLFAATGHAPYASATWPQVISKLVNGAPPDLTGLPGEFHPLLSRCLSHTPAQRMSATEVLMAAQQRLPSAADVAASSLLPQHVLAHLDAYRRRLPSPEVRTLGPNGTLPLPDLVRTRRIRRSWRRRVEGWMPSELLISGRGLYVTAGGHVSALDAVSGELRWRVSAGRGQVSAPAASAGLVVVGGQGRIVALDGTTGEERWARAIGQHVQAQPVASDGVLYVSSRDGNVLALRAATGKPQWRYATGDGAASTPAISSGVLYVADAAGWLHALRASTGEQVWRLRLGGGVEAAPVVGGGTVYVGSTDQFLYAIDAATGARRWRYRTGGPVRSAPAVLADTVHVASADGGVYALHGSSGEVRWRYRTGGAIRCSPTAADNTVYVGSLDAHVYALHADTGALRWRFRTGAWIVSSPAVADGFVYVGSHDQHVYALDAALGAGPLARA